MKEILNKLSCHKTLSKEEAKNILINISKGKYNNSQVASFLTVFIMRNISVDELEGFQNALLELCIPIDLKDYNTIDLCGTRVCFSKAWSYFKRDFIGYEEYSINI